MRKNYIHIRTQEIIKHLSNKPLELLEFTDLFNMNIPVKKTDIKEINEILQIFKYYYMNILYLKNGSKESEENTLNYFFQYFVDYEVKNMEEMEVVFSNICKEHSYYYQEGKTTGIYGPYIWKHQIEKEYDVDVLGIDQRVKVVFMSDFISCGWLRYYSSNKYGAAGWAKEDGVLYSVDEAYPSKSGPEFNVSFLKHEAQHILDYDRYPFLQSDSLEFRAKLVELYYYPNTDRFLRILEEAVDNPENSHSYASFWIVKLLKNRNIVLEDITDENYANIKQHLKNIYQKHTYFLESNLEDKSLIVFTHKILKE